MLRRLLNITSIVCLVLCVALMGLWVRSYYSIDSLRVRFTARQLFMFTSMDGRLEFFNWPLDTAKLRDSASKERRWSVSSEPFTHQRAFVNTSNWTKLGFNYGSAFVLLPYWFLVLTTGSLAVIFQLRLEWPFRFTLRSLFIITTFLAVVLGMIAWLDRAWIGK
jgi:hypothetical protein